MIVCTKCGVSKDIEKFSYQKTKPGKLYAWCDPCRRQTKDPNNRRNPLYGVEVKELRAKAKQLRRFSPEQVAEMKKQRQAGVPVKQIASSFSVNVDSIYRALKYRN